MKVNRGNFDKIYRKELDPWQIGDADYGRYNLYYNLIVNYTKSKTNILDIGCGVGAFLSRFNNDFQDLIGLEISHTAIEKGKQKYPFIHYIQGSVESVSQVFLDKNRYDAIIYSDVICYLDETQKNNSLKWVSEHLQSEGIALIAAWVPGGKYLEYNELNSLIRKYFYIEYENLLESQHGYFICKKRKKVIAITIDSETWHPVPDGKFINWENDVFQPTNKLLNLCAQEQIKLTLMAEIGEYFWLQQNQPEIAQLMAQQWQEAICQGHDVQLHLHPSWLPELGACYQDDQWSWDWSKAKADNYPGNLTDLISRCKSTLEAILQKVDPTYQVNSFRAGAYQVQPFKQLYDALTANGIFCDSSVYAGGYSKERGYDFCLAYSNHQPYFANPYDPQLKAPPSEQGIVEIPIFTYRQNRRWFLDGKEGNRFAQRLLKFLRKKINQIPSSEAYRRRKQIKRVLGGAYFRLRTLYPWLNRLLPRSFAHFLTFYSSELLVNHEYFVIIGHTKGEHDWEGITRNIRQLKEENKFEFVTLSAMAKIAKQDLLSHTRQSAKEEAEYQVQREYKAVLGEVRNAAQSYHLQNMIPVDRKKVLDLGCGAGYWSDRIAQLYPWMEVTGIDYGEDFIAKAKNQFSSERVLFQVADFAHLSFSNESFDCVYADNTLEHAYNVDLTLQEVYRVLRWGGVLVAAIPSDAYNPRKICDNHTWKTAPHEVRLRLGKVGFVNIEIQEIDTFYKLGMTPYPPANDKMMYILAWKRRQNISRLERAVEAMDWVYKNISPEKPNESGIPQDIINSGYAWCGGYALVLQFILERQGYKTRRVAFWMKPHPKGHGIEKVDSHALLEVYLNGKWQLLDPTCNIYFNGNSLDDLVHNPDLALPVFADHEPDTRFRERQYELYCTKWAFERCYRTYYENPLIAKLKKIVKSSNRLYDIAQRLRNLFVSSRS